MQAQKQLEDEEISHLSELRKLGVDLTSYLLSQHPKPDKVLRVVTHGEAGHVHVHPYQ